MSAASSSTTVTIGPSAFLSACRSTTRREGMPRARAATTNGCASISIIELRRYRGERGVHRSQAIVAVEEAVEHAHVSCPLRRRDPRSAEELVKKYDVERRTRRTHRKG